jgi:hypothetical protein
MFSVPWCHVIYDVRFVRLYSRLLYSFVMLYLCYFWLFPYTVVQHESHSEWRSCCLPVTPRVPLVEQELFSLPQPLHGHMDFSEVSAYWNIDNCSSCLVCAQYCQCLWIVLFWSPFRFSLMFMQYLWVYKYILRNVK